MKKHERIFWFRQLLFFLFHWLWVRRKPPGPPRRTFFRHFTPPSFFLSRKEALPDFPEPPFCLKILSSTFRAFPAGSRGKNTRTRWG